MSTKTLRKRIALTAVAAMGLGLLSATSASATQGDLAFDATSTGGKALVSVINDSDEPAKPC